MTPINMDIPALHHLGRHTKCDLDIFPPCCIPDWVILRWRNTQVMVIGQCSRIKAPPRSKTEDRHAEASEPHITFIQSILKLPIESRSMKEGKVGVHDSEVSIYQTRRKVQIWEFAPERLGILASLLVPLTLPLPHHVT